MTTLLDPGVGCLFPSGTPPWAMPWRRRLSSGSVVSGALLSGAVVVGAVLRLQSLSSVGFGSDEAVYATQARAMAEGVVVLRAHPPLWIAAASLLGSEASDAALRGLGALVGVCGIILAAALAASVPGIPRRMAAPLAAWTVALMPYHVDVSRQFLLDGPAAAAGAVLVLSVVRWEVTGSRRWLSAAIVSTVVGVLVKEDVLLLVVALVVVAVVSPTRRRTQAAVASLVASVGAVAGWVLVGVSSAQVGTLGDYASWQVTRRPNMPWDLYATTVAPRVGVVLVACAALGVTAAWRTRAGATLTAVTAVPLLALQLWPVKGYALPMLVMPFVATLAAVGAVTCWGWVIAGSERSRRTTVVAALALTPVVAVTSVGAAFASPAAAPLPGRDGLPVVREVAAWIARDPAAVLVGSSALATVIGYYAGVPAGVVPDRHDTLVNPAYRVRGPMRPRYYVWDTWTAAADPERSAALLSAARRADAQVVLTRTTEGSGAHQEPATVVVLEAAP